MYSTCGPCEINGGAYNPYCSRYEIYSHTHKMIRKCSSRSLEHLYPEVLHPRAKWAKGERKSLSVSLHLFDFVFALSRNLKSLVHVSLNAFSNPLSLLSLSFFPLHQTSSAMPSSVDTLTMCWTMHEPLQIPSFLYLKPFICVFTCGASVIPQWLKHLQTPVGLIRLNRISQEHKGDAFVPTVHKYALWVVGILQRLFT